MSVNDVFERSSVVRAIAPRVRKTEHIVHFYGDEAFFLQELAEYLMDGLRDGTATLVIATPEHRDELNARLAARGIDLDPIRRDGRYVEADAAGVLAQFMRDGALDPVRFGDVVGSLIVAAMGPDGSRRVRAFGEMVALLCYSGRYDLARELEALWVALSRRLSYSLLCAYPSGLFRDERRADDLGEIAHLHDRVIRSGHPAPVEPRTDA